MPITDLRLRAKSKGVDDVADTNKREERIYMDHIEVEETKQDKGFTLVELLIVIVILGILATVTVFAVTGITNKGKTSACQSDLKVIQTAEEAYNAQTGAYTATQSDLVTAGLMHAVSPNFTIAVTGSGPTATYALTGVDNTATGGNNCSGING